MYLNQSYAAYLNQLSSSINTNFGFVFVSIGVPCNLVSIIIFWRLMKNKTNMGILGILQSLIDMAIPLYLLFVYRLSPSVFPISPQNRDDFQCKLYTFIRRFILDISSWTTVISTFDRFTYVLYGHDGRLKKIFKNKWGLTGSILTVFFIIGIIDIPNLFFYLINGTCSANNYVKVSSEIISTFLRTYIPFVRMIMFNLLMIRKIFRYNRMTFNQNSLSHKENQFTRVVMAYSVYFFILHFPHSFYYIMCNINLFSDGLKSDPLMAASYSLARVITGTLAFFVQIFSLFMHLGFNKLYKKELLRLLSRFFQSTFSNTTHNVH